MRALVSKLMAVWLLTLAVSGWCCHLPLDSESVQPLADSVERSPPCCHHCSQHVPEPSAPQKPKTVCEGVCVYLPVQKTHLEARQILVPFDFAAVISSRDDLRSAADPLWALQPAKSGPPLRLHLLHQLLLI